MFIPTKNSRNDRICFLGKMYFWNLLIVVAIVR